MSILTSFTKVVYNGLAKKIIFSTSGTKLVRHSSLWEPDYLILAKQKTPEYGCINFQITSYDFVIIENYQSVIHKLARLLEIHVPNTWAAPHQDLKVNKLKTKSEVTEHQYILKVYERNIQVVDVKSHIMPLFIEAVITACPPGVKIRIQKHLKAIEQKRYLPNVKIIELNQELDAMQGPKKKKIKKMK